MVSLPLVFSALSVMFGIYEFARTSIARARTRAYELRIVEKILLVHYDNLDYVFEDPAPSDDMRSFLLFVSDSISDRKMARLICEVFTEEDCRSTSAKGMSSKAETLVSELDNFRKTRPDLVEAFEKALSSGIFALTYRWPETSCKAEAVLGSLMTERKREIMTVYRFAQSHSSVLTRPNAASSPSTGATRGH